MWMDQISMQNKTNFFEARVSNYAKSGVGQNAVSNVYGLDDEF
jgi:ribonucleoside-diphosphate reductase subunit M2